MYEMEGPRRATPLRADSFLAARCHEPPARARHPRKTPVSRYLPRPRGCPRVVPVSNGECIFTCLGAHRARACGQLFSVFSISTFFPQNAAGFPHVAVIIHGIIHSSSTGHEVNIRAAAFE